MQTNTIFFFWKLICLSSQVKIGYCYNFSLILLFSSTFHRWPRFSIGNHTTPSSIWNWLHEWVFQKVSKLQWVFEKLSSVINSKLNSKSYYLLTIYMQNLPRKAQRNRKLPRPKSCADFIYSDRMFFKRIT